MRMKDLIRETKNLMMSGIAVVWEGPPGTGKSYASSQLVGWLCEEYPTASVGVCGTFMAVESPIGGPGLPWKGELTYKGKKYTVTDPAIPRWFLARDARTGEVAPADQFDIAICLLEEWGQGDIETKRAFTPLLLDRGIGQYFLPKGSHVLALTNREARDGVTKELDITINRVSVQKVDPDATGWKEDFADHPYTHNGKRWEVMGTSKAWALANPTILFEPKPTKQGSWCSPRSFTAADRYAQVATKQNGGRMPVESPAFKETITSLIGTPAGHSYHGHLEFSLNLPSKEDVVRDPTGTMVPDKVDQMMVMTYELAGRTEAHELAPVLTYINRIKAKDMHVAFVSTVLRRDFALSREPAMLAWINANQTLVNLVASMAKK